MSDRIATINIDRLKRLLNNHIVSVSAAQAWRISAASRAIVDKEMEDTKLALIELDAACANMVEATINNEGISISFTEKEGK